MKYSDLSRSATTSDTFLPPAQSRRCAAAEAQETASAAGEPGRGARGSPAWRYPAAAALGASIVQPRPPSRPPLAPGRARMAASAPSGTAPFRARRGPAAPRTRKRCAGAAPGWQRRVGVLSRRPVGTESRFVDDGGAVVVALLGVYCSRCLGPLSVVGGAGLGTQSHNLPAFASSQVLYAAEAHTSSPVTRFVPSRMAVGSDGFSEAHEQTSRLRHAVANNSPESLRESAGFRKSGWTCPSETQSPSKKLPT